METLFEINGKVRLESPQPLYNFMKELLNYELFVTEKDYNTGLLSIADSPTVRLARPFTEEGVSRKGIKEFAWVIGVDAKMDALFIDLLSIGDINRTLVTPWLSYRGTFYYAASAIYLVHNHPSGDPTPSPADIAITKEVIEGGIKMERPLIDHIIMGDDCYYAFEEKMQLLEKEVKEDIIGKKALRQILNEEKAEKLKAYEINSRLLDGIDEKDKEIAALKAQLKRG